MLLVAKSCVLLYLFPSTSVTTPESLKTILDHNLDYRFTIYDQILRFATTNDLLVKDTCDTNQTITADDWYHIVAVYNVSVKTLTFFKLGVGGGLSALSALVPLVPCRIYV